MSNLIYLKLGGSLITDKTGIEAVRTDVLTRLAAEIDAARTANPDLKLLLGHGSGSFGHVAAARFGTRQGVASPAQWAGFAQVSSTAARLNKLVVEALQDTHVPAITLQPSASVVCVDGRITQIAMQPLQSAIEANIVPVIYGDVAFDLSRGGTIISTEEIMMAVADALPPAWLLLAGETAGVLDQTGHIIPQITHRTLTAIADALGESRGTDVTGGMAAKVNSMLDLVDAHPQLQIRIFSGLVPGQLKDTLLQPDKGNGTLLKK